MGHGTWGWGWGRGARRRGGVRAAPPSGRALTAALSPRRADAGHHEAVGVGADFCPVAARLPGDAGRSVPLQTGQPRRGCPRRGHGQILLGAEALHQPHHQAEVGAGALLLGEVEGRDVECPLGAGGLALLPSG